MSLAETQRAIALLIRQPERHRDRDLELFLHRFALTPREAQQIRALAADPRVRKYGRAMAGVRWETTWEKLRFVRGCLPEALLEDLFWQEFDPNADRVEASELAISFLRHITEDPKARSAIVDQGPRGSLDILKLELARLELWTRKREHEAPSEESALAQAIFTCVGLEHDVLAHVQAVTRASNGRASPPEPRQLIAMLAWIPGEAHSRFFEIDRPAMEFLEAAREGREVAPIQPETRAELAALGLCKPAGRNEGG